MRKVVLIICSFLLLSAAYGQAKPKVLSKKAAKDSYIYGSDVGSKNDQKPHAHSLKVHSTPVRQQATFSSEAQHSEPNQPVGSRFSCGTVKANEIMHRRFPDWRSEADFEQFIASKAKLYTRQQQARKRAGSSAPLYKIPVIVHVLYFEGQTVGEDHNITKEQIYSQFEVLNEDYRKMRNTCGYNVDKAGADAQIVFVPALYDPEGKLLEEPGIHRMKAEDITDGEYTIASDNRYMEMNWTEWLKKQTHWNPNCYLNLWTVGLTNGLMGYATLPDSDLPGIAGVQAPAPDEYEGVVVDYRRFGSYEKGAFPGVAQDSKGRTATHEIGHFLGLRHTFGDAPSDNLGQYPDGCEYTDYVDDTPREKEPMYGNKPLYLCGEREMVENYMDYSSDHVKNVFTKGQVERMHIVLENSPRRKELTKSTVADLNGNKMPEVEFISLASELKVFELFSFETKVERFPGTYHWEFEGGVPATSSERNPGVFFTTPGRKKITLTVKNEQSSVIHHRYVDVKEFEACEPMYKPTLEVLPPLRFVSIVGYGHYMTGHGDLFAIKQIASKFAVPQHNQAKALTQVEMKLKRFDKLVGYNPENTFDLLIMNEDDEGKPNEVIQQQRVRVGDVYDAYKDGKPFLVKLNNPIVFDSDSEEASTDSYFIAIDLDYHPGDYTYERGYSFELEAGISPVNFSWSYGPTMESISDEDADPTYYEYIWQPYSAPEATNAWDASILMHLLPKFTSDIDGIAEPEFIVPEFVQQNTDIVVSLADKPANVESVYWTIYKPTGNEVIIGKDEVALLYNEPGEYTISATYTGQPCVQKTTTKSFVVQGVTFDIESYRKLSWEEEDEDGEIIVVESKDYVDVLYCTDKPIYLEVVETFSSSEAELEYTWSGGAIPEGTMGLTVEVSPKETTTYTATTVDENGLEVKRSIVITVVPPQPSAKFELISPSSAKLDEDTYAIFMDNLFDSELVIKNLSENVQYSMFTLIRERDGRDMEIYMDEDINEKGIYKVGMNQAFDGEGLYTLTLTASHPGCNDEVSSTTSIKLQVGSQASFGEVGFTANGKPVAVVFPADYQYYAGDYIAYVEQGGNVLLKAESEEIKKILWVEQYTQQRYTSKEVQLYNVRDRVQFVVEVVREREINGQPITFKEQFAILVLFTCDIKGKAVADFYPQFKVACVGQPVKFVNTSRNAVNFRWEFSGGEYVGDERLTDLSALWSPNRVFNTPGTYTIKLVITAVDGSELSKELSLAVGKAEQPEIILKTVNQYSRIDGDVIYTYDYRESNTGLGVIVLGSGISNEIRYETYRYAFWLDEPEWVWQNEDRQEGLLRPSFVFYGDETDGINDPKLRVIAKTCEGEEVEREYTVKLVPEVILDNYSLRVNDKVYSFGQYLRMGINQVPEGELLSLELVADEDILDNTDIFWGELHSDGTETILSTDFKLEVYPTKNTTYTIFFSDKLRLGYERHIPVQVNIASEDIRVMNVDLTLDADNVVEVPYGYTSEIVVWIDGVVNPVWSEQLSGKVLSTQSAVVLEPQAGVYVVTANVGGRTLKSTVEVRVGEKPKDPEDDDEVKEDEYKVMQLYPVPARDVLNIESSYDGDAYIVDSLGRLVKRFTLRSGLYTLSVNDLSAGVYKLVVQQAKQGRIVSRSFIVVR